MAPALPSARRAALSGDTFVFLSPDTIATRCGLTPEALSLLAGLPEDSAEREPWHPRLQSLLRNLFYLFARAREVHADEDGAPFWAAHRTLRALGGRTLVEAVADGDWTAVDAHLDASR